MRFRHTLDQFAGRPWWVSTLGSATVVAYVLALFYVGGVDAGRSAWLFVGGVLGGLVAGFALGTNVYDGMAAGLRAGAYGVGALTVVATAAFLVIWQTPSGEPFFYWASFYGLVGAVLFVPIFGFVGLVSGALGVVLRRWTLPDHLNPRAY